MVKDVSLMKSFEERYLKVFLKSEVCLQEILKRIGFRKFEKITFKGALKSFKSVVFGSIKI
jgi:hypothetical protein